MDGRSSRHTDGQTGRFQCTTENIRFVAVQDFFLMTLLTLSQTSPGFYVSTLQVFKKNWGEKKKEIAHNKQFLFFQQSFLPFWRTFCHFHQIYNCHLQTRSVWKNLKFIISERSNRIRCVCETRMPPQ